MKLVPKLAGGDNPVLVVMRGSPAGAVAGRVAGADLVEDLELGRGRPSSP